MTREAQAGVTDLYHLDESGFAPTLPTGYTWAREGTRPLVSYEAPEGRRVNVIGARAPFGPAPRLVYESRTTTLDSAGFLRFAWQEVASLPAAPADLPPDYRRGRPCVIVLDNYAVHKSQVVKDALPALERAGVILFYLPPYSPELNAMAPLWRQVKYEDLPIRSYPTAAALQEAVDGALARHACAVHQSTTPLGEAA